MRATVSKWLIGALMVISGLIASGVSAQTLTPITVYPVNNRPTVQALIPFEAISYVYTYDYRYLLSISGSGVAVLDAQNKYEERYPLLTHLPHPGVADVQDFQWNGRRYVVTFGGSEVRVWDITNPASHSVAVAKGIRGTNNSPYFQEDQRVGVVFNSGKCFIIVGARHPSELLALEFTGTDLILRASYQSVGGGLGVSAIASNPPQFNMIAVGTYGGIIQLLTVAPSDVVGAYEFYSVGVGKLVTNRGQICALSFVPNTNPPHLLAMDDTERVYLCRTDSRLPINVLSLNRNLSTSGARYFGRYALHARRFSFTVDGRFFAVKSGGIYHQSPITNWIELFRAGNRVSRLRVAGQVGGNYFRFFVDSFIWLHGEETMDNYLVLGPGGDAWHGPGMLPLQYANAPWEVAHPLPGGAGSALRLQFPPLAC